MIISVAVLLFKRETYTQENDFFCYVIWLTVLSRSFGLGCRAWPIAFLKHTSFLLRSALSWKLANYIKQNTHVQKIRKYFPWFSFFFPWFFLPAFLCLFLALSLSFSPLDTVTSLTSNADGCMSVISMPLLMDRYEKCFF